MKIKTMSFGKKVLIVDIEEFHLIKLGLEALPQIYQPCELIDKSQDMAKEIDKLDSYRTG